ncbi:hypothetical protein I5907_17660 [Panacibacter sp. DH6]|uniref:Uncharacterized protein n=1 Tax=Panacibacter microcysteis TaxID=2793269 RepID=A0A931ME41_9BACT|nr:hypothetical protein [Panacibacter microcysteis]MBG9378069.1 hypothetical protein [Panacibacter microcysteis]
MELTDQLVRLFILPLAIACISWTVTHEQIFLEPRTWCQDCSKNAKTLLVRKFFYLFTCEYCFSHYVTALILFITKFQLLYTGWRGYIIAGFALVWIANVYMSLYNLVRTDLKKENLEAELKSEEKKAIKRTNEQAL